MFAALTFYAKELLLRPASQDPSTCYEETKEEVAAKEKKEEEAAACQSLLKAVVTAASGRGTFWTKNYGI